MLLCLPDLCGGEALGACPVLSPSPPLPLPPQLCLMLLSHFSEIVFSFLSFLCFCYFSHSENLKVTASMRV